MNWNILQRELFSEKSEIFPLFPKTRKFGKFIYSGLQLDKVSAKIIFSKNGHPSSGILSEIFQFLSLKSEFFLIFWKKSRYSKIRKFYIPSPTSVPCFSKIKESFFLHSSLSSSRPLAALVVVQVRGVQVGTTMYTCRVNRDEWWMINDDDEWRKKVCFDFVET